MPTGAELFVRACVQLGLDPIFTLVGDHLNEVLAAAARAGMRVVRSKEHTSEVQSPCNGVCRLLLEKKPVGGTCSRRGCDPKKVLVGVAESVDWTFCFKVKGIPPAYPLFPYPALFR